MLKVSRASLKGNFEEKPNNWKSVLKMYIKDSGTNGKQKMDKGGTHMLPTFNTIKEQPGGSPKINRAAPSCPCEAHSLSF